MNDAAFNQLLDTALRRKLTAEEQAQVQACLARDPQAKAVWEEEMALSQLLNRLPQTETDEELLAVLKEVAMK